MRNDTGGGEKGHNISENEEKVKKKQSSHKVEPSNGSPRDTKGAETVNLLQQECPQISVRMYLY